MEINKPDSASKWLRWGENHIPFNKLDRNSNSLLLYAHSYAEAKDTTSAVRLAEKGEQTVLDNLTNHIGEFDQLQSEIQQLDQEVKKARMNANMEKQRELKNRIQSLVNRRDSIRSNLFRSISQLIIIQRIYYMAELEEKASKLTEEVNQITTSRIQFPDSEESNKAQFRQLGL